MKTGCSSILSVRGCVPRRAEKRLRRQRLSSLNRSALQPAWVWVCAPTRVPPHVGLCPAPCPAPCGFVPRPVSRPPAALQLVPEQRMPSRGAVFVRFNAVKADFWFRTAEIVCIEGGRGCSHAPALPADSRHMLIPTKDSGVRNNDICRHTGIPGFPFRWRISNSSWGVTACDHAGGNPMGESRPH